MKNRSTKTMILGAAFGVLIGTIGAQGQTAGKPSRSVETFGSWDVECTVVKVRKAAEKTAKKADTKKKDAKKKIAKKDDAKKSESAKMVVTTRTICEAVQPYRNRKTNNEVARLAVAIDPKDKSKFVAVLRTITDVSFKATPEIVNDGKTLIKGAFRSCFRKYCYIRFPLDKKIEAVLVKSKKLAVQYPVSSGEIIRINMSSNGLKDAFASLKNK